MKAIHITFKAFTSTYKMPFINTGVGVSCPVPSYSSIVGLINCCAGRFISKNETRIGYKYTHNGIGRDMETTRRLGLENGMLKRVTEPGIATREFHVNPVLDIYLDNIDLMDCFIKPIGVPTLGRSQDIAWITKAEEIEMTPCNTGRIKPTLIPFPLSGIGGRLARLCDYFYNDDNGQYRQPDKMILYQIVPESDMGIYITRSNLYKFNEDSEEVIYMHSLGEDN